MSNSKYEGNKFNKQKCRKCMYRKKITSAPVGSVFCDYAGVTDQTCLHVVNGQLVDRRGEDYDHCLLYKTGDPIMHQAHFFDHRDRGAYNNG